MTIKNDVRAILHGSGAVVHDVRLPPKATLPAITLKTVRTMYPKSRDRKAVSTKRVRMEAHIWSEDPAVTGDLADRCEALLAESDGVFIHLESRDDYFYTEAGRHTVRLEFFAWPA